MKIERLSKLGNRFFRVYTLVYRSKVQPRVKPKINMNGTVKVVCYRYKILSNGECPLMIRLCKDGKKKYQSLGISIKAELWDFKANLPKKKCPYEFTNRFGLFLRFADKRYTFIKMESDSERKRVHHHRTQDREETDYPH